MLSDYEVYNLKRRIISELTHKQALKIKFDTDILANLSPSDFAKLTKNKKLIRDFALIKRSQFKLINCA